MKRTGRAASARPATSPATQFLIKNHINRYLINSPMLPGMKKNADGSLTLYIRKDLSIADKESTWLPAPDDLI